MDMKVYKEKLFMLDVYDKLLAAEEEIKSEKILEVDASISDVRKKFNV